jgi:beta-mannosidase
VRRAFAAIAVVIAEEDDKLIVFGINDTPQPWTGELRCGFFQLAGGLADDRTIPVQLAANASTPLTERNRDIWNALGCKRSGAFALLQQNGHTVAQDRLFLERFKDLELVPQPAIHVEKQSGALVLAASVFVWGACLDINGELPVADNCFDLLPGIPYRVPWNGTPVQPEVQHCGNRIFVPKT